MWKENSNNILHACKRIKKIHFWILRAHPHYTITHHISIYYIRKVYRKCEEATKKNENAHMKLSENFSFSLYSFIKMLCNKPTGWKSFSFFFSSFHLIFFFFFYFVIACLMYIIEEEEEKKEEVKRKNFLRLKKIS